MLFHTDLPKIDNRMGGTPDHNKAIAQGFVAMYGSYPVDEANKTIIVKFEGQEGLTAARNAASGERFSLRTRACSARGNGVMCVQ
jgi:hypothetical protein